MRWANGQYQDGRFLKTLRDLAVSLVVKNELRYDYVVGNPPYVRVQRLPDELRRYWVNQYEWAEGNFDIYIPFFERALTDWLHDGGKLGFKWRVPRSRHGCRRLDGASPKGRPGRDTPA